MGDPVVKLQSGSVCGLVENHEEGFKYYAFKGIPYAEPPVGKLRFKDPVPKKAWSGILNCKEYATMMLQYDWIRDIRSINEDGLCLNVFTRTINDLNANKPVMVVIHGGGFLFFSGCDHYIGIEHLIRKDLVIVTMNYRLGILGFLDLEDEIAPGNQGLKDQVMSLRWVRQNIKQFGGDPNNITAYGTSAGASAANYLAISPLSKGLIHKVISQSSVVFNEWTAVANPRANAIKLCSFLGKELTDSQEILDFLQSADAQTLLEAQEKLCIDMDLFPFGPGVDRKSSDPFLPVDPVILANEGVHLPYLVGYTAQEGLMLLLGSREDLFRKLDQDHQLFFTHNGNGVLARHNLNATQVKRLYYKSETVSCKNLDNFVNLMSDIHFVEGIHQFARVQAERSSASTYLYVFDYDGPESISKAILKDAPSGVSHMDDTPYVLKMKLFEQLGIDYFKKGTKSYRIMEQMTEMWANFAKHGRPTIDTSELIPVHWLPITDGTLLRYLSVDEDLLMKSLVNVDQKLLSAKSIKV